MKTNETKKTKKHYLGVAFAGAVMAAGLTGAMAHPASALVTETDSVLIDGGGFDFGGATYAAGVPTTSGTVSWDQAWFGVVPKVSGRLHMEGVATACAHVQVISYDSTGAELRRDTSGTQCAPDNDHKSWPADVTGAAGAASVKVTVQSQNLNGWSNVGSQTLRYGPTVKVSHPQINRAVYDLGSGDLSGGNPTGPATLSWNVSGGGTLTPRLTGTLFLDDTTNCARLRMRFIDVWGNEDATRYGGTVCGTNDQLKKFSVDLAPYGNADLASVQIAIEEFDASPPPGAWVQVGATTEYLA